MANTNTASATNTKTIAEMEAEILRYQTENAALAKKLAEAPKPKALRCQVADKGGVSVYGLGQFPTTLYKEQWARLLDFADEIRAFIVANDSQLSSKADKPKAPTAAQKAEAEKAALAKQIAELTAKLGNS